MDSPRQDVDAALRKAHLSLSASVANFDANAILRGAQLTVVGGLRALQNPSLFQYEHYRQAAIAVFLGLLVRFLVAVPILLLKFGVWMLSFVVDLQHSIWDDTMIEGLDFIANHVLQLPFFLMSLMRYITPTLDQVFMDSLLWVDQTYLQKHKTDDPSKLRPMYYHNLSKYPTHGPDKAKKSPFDALISFLSRFGRRAVLSLAVYFLSFLPVVGRFVLPAVSYYTFNKAVGTAPATLVFGLGILLPRHYLVVFLQTYFASRSLMRELLVPYFSRVRFDKEQKRKFFHDREGVLFGFGIGFYLFLKTPIFGVLIYGIAEASTAYLITKITDPPPPPAYRESFAESQVSWKNKHAFLHLPLLELDKLETTAKRRSVQSTDKDSDSTWRR